MQTYGPSVRLAKFRKEAIYRQSMCAAIASEPGEPNAAIYTELANHAQASIDAIDARTIILRNANDVLTRGRALERVRKLRTKQSYRQARLDLRADAEAIYRTLLPSPPSALDRVGTARAIAMVEGAIANLALPSTPESVRTEHVPVLEGHLARLREADLVEDEADAALIAVRAGIVLFKAEEQREREVAYGRLVAIIGKSDADEFFLSSYSRDDDEEEDDIENVDVTDPENGGGGGPSPAAG